MNKSFAIHRNKGFSVKLPNGVTISTQFGGGNYCDNRSSPIEAKEPQESNSVEFAAYRESGEWVTKEVAKRARLQASDDVVGYVHPSEWLKLVNAASRLSNVTK